jgi:CcmD family protein
MLEKALFSQGGQPPGTESKAPDDRATTFQPVEGGGEHRSGATLLVEAYAVIWTLLMVWLVLLWRKQVRLNERLDGLEGAIAKASARTASPGVDPGAPGVREETRAQKLGGQTS